MQPLGPLLLALPANLTPTSDPPPLPGPLLVCNPPLWIMLLLVLLLLRLMFRRRFSNIQPVDPPSIVFDRAGCQSCLWMNNAAADEPLYEWTPLCNTVWPQTQTLPLLTCQLLLLMMSILARPGGIPLLMANLSLQPAVQNIKPLSRLDAEWFVMFCPSFCCPQHSCLLHLECPVEQVLA